MSGTTRSKLIVLAVATAVALSVLTGGVLAGVATDSPDVQDVENADDGAPGDAADNRSDGTEPDVNETDGNETEGNEADGNGTDGFGALVSSFVQDLIGNGTGANATDGPLGAVVADFVLAEKPGNAPVHAGPPAWLVNGTGHASDHPGAPADAGSRTESASGTDVGPSESADPGDDGATAEDAGPSESAGPL